MIHIFSNSNKLFSSATTTTALRVLKLFDRKQISTSSIIPLKKFYKLLKGKIKIIGVGGVDSGTSAYEKFLAGASYIQLYTGMVLSLIHI